MKNQTAKTEPNSAIALDADAIQKAIRRMAHEIVEQHPAPEKLVHHVTSGERVKFADGHEEDHKMVKSRDPAAIRNLVDWILSLPGGTAPK